MSRLGKVKRVVVLGNNNIGVELTTICHGRDDIEIVSVRPDPGDTGEDGWQKSFLKLCRDLQLPMLPKGKLSSDTVVDALKELKPDIIFSFHCRSIIPKKVIDIPPEGVINISHFSMLPKYRGCNNVLWPILHGETETGVSSHYIDEGIDTGDILFQDPVPIRSQDTARDVFDRSVDIGIESFVKNIDKLLSGDIEPQPQNDADAIYYSRKSIDLSQNFVDWNQPTETVWNFIRAFIFPPFQYARTRFHGGELEIVRHADYNNEGKLPVQPGTIVSMDTGSNLIQVATLTGFITIKEVAFGGARASVEKLSQMKGLKRGSLLYL